MEQGVYLGMQFRTIILPHSTTIVDQHIGKSCAANKQYDDDQVAISMRKFISHHRDALIKYLPMTIYLPGTICSSMAMCKIDLNEPLLNWLTGVPCDTTQVCGSAWSSCFLGEIGHACFLPGLSLLWA